MSDMTSAIKRLRKTGIRSDRHKLDGAVGFKFPSISRLQLVLVGQKPTNTSIVNNLQDASGPRKAL